MCHKFFNFRKTIEWLSTNFEGDTPIYVYCTAQYLLQHLLQISKCDCLLHVIIVIRKDFFLNILISASDCSSFVLIFQAIWASMFLLSLVLLKKSVNCFEKSSQLLVDICETDRSLQLFFCLYYCSCKFYQVFTHLTVKYFKLSKIHNIEID